MASPSPYRPPEQSPAGQLFDSLFVVALVAATLLVCLYLTVLSAAPAPEPAAQTAAVIAAPATEANAAAATAVAAATSTGAVTAEQQKLKTERFTALGWDDAKVAERKATIAAKSYEFDWLMLFLTAIVVIAYFVFLVRTSDKELREVINERFGPSTGTQSKESS
jgi:3-deoxy-D-manno-octulosonic-acid transferase